MGIQLNDCSNLNFELLEFEDHLGSLCFNVKLHFDGKDFNFSSQFNFWFDYTNIDKFIANLKNDKNAVMSSMDHDFDISIEKDGDFFIKIEIKKGGFFSPKEFRYFDKMSETGILDLKEFFLNFPKWW
ncbi:hypothetical protein RvVAR0630_13260 [Agrobacterium vitis]|uniref:hypothetical protein n=1 Tax=Agrobacterium vitis TaxID=373 RepID=UPI0015D76F81|nr:hypothetical protein [Agrobacterium vitis]BCH58702.1 hypothetical protein RvVAR0630_13260 [Agrobacterium vitis]